MSATPPPRELPAWAAARTLSDVGELLAQWLERRRTWSPVHVGRGPDAETGPHLVAALAAANRAGYLTDCSQPGVDRPGLRQRAYVSGLLAPDHAWYAQQLMLDSELVVVLGHRDAARRRTANPPTVSVALTVVDDEPVTFGGRFPSRHQDPLLDAPLPRPVGRLLRAAEYVEVIDPRWGRDDLLWPWLHRLAADLADGTADAWVRSVSEDHTHRED